MENSIQENYKMKKILFITTRNPYSGRYSGDVIRSLKIINLLKKKYSLDVLCFKNEKESGTEKNFISFNSPNFFSKLIFCIFSCLTLKPIQLGLFYSKQMKDE